ncbi:MAG: methionyl-tRNA formyltransferase [Oscillospiraceae bacterium]|nr:methionyl-tRNA formyltransferase [Oscillospiraceae bacterium]
MRIVFMGTPDFSVPCLQALIDDGHDVCAVFTQPDKPKGRHGVLTPPPVKELALKYDIPVYQPKTLKTDEAKELFKSLNAELAIVVAYGKILPGEFIHAPKYGCINMHASLLPKLRGAAPIQWSIITGEKRTGVTSMQMDEGLDTGDMLISKSVEIGENETAEELHDRLSSLGSEVMRETIAALQAGDLHPVKQDNEKSTYAPILTKELSKIDWNDTAQHIHDKIRGLYSWPGASGEFDGKVIKIHLSRLAGACSGKPGEIIESGKRLVVSCGDGNAVEILVLQAPGKRAMPAQDFLRGNPIEKGAFFE